MAASENDKVMVEELQGRDTLPLDLLISKDLHGALGAIFGVFLAMGATVAIFYVIGNRTVFAQDPRKGTIRTIRMHQTWLAVLLILLLNGLIQMRGEPLIPNLIGIAVNLCWQAGTIFSIRNQKKKLQKLNEA